MAVKIRMQEIGRVNRHTFRIVVIDTKSRRDGPYVELLGWYNPFAKEEDQMYSLESDRLKHWLSVGAIISPRVETIASKLAPAIIKEHKEKQVAGLAKAAKQRRDRRRRRKAATAA